jgi:hypothetical protein
VTLLRFERLTVSDGKARKGMMIAAARRTEKKNVVSRCMDELEGVKRPQQRERLFYLSRPHCTASPSAPAAIVEAPD